MPDSAEVGGDTSLPDRGVIRTLDSGEPDDAAVPPNDAKDDLDIAASVSSCPRRD
jgi:hypothetical protein